VARAPRQPGGRAHYGGAPPGFRKLVEEALLQVPKGRVTTYGDIARALGDLRAARAVGETLATNPSPSRVPCHRVVLVDGGLGGYAFGGPEAKAQLLRKEGVEVRDGRVRNLGAVAVRDLELSPVFGQYARLQEQLAASVTVEDFDPAPEVAIGVDASYGAGDARAWGAACAFDATTGEQIAEAVCQFAPPVPYVPGYLAFREIPGIVAAVGRLPARARRGAVILVDGQGILHPRRCGVASMVGLELGMPAVGVAKSKLIGTVDSRSRRYGRYSVRKVAVDGEVRGFEILPAKGEPKGSVLYASPGTGVGLWQSAKLAMALTEGGDESPRPILAADRLSRRARLEASA